MTAPIQPWHLEAAKRILMRPNFPHQQYANATDALNKRSEFIAQIIADAAMSAGRNQGESK